MFSSNKSNKELVQESQTLLKNLGHEVSIDHLFQLYTKLIQTKVTEEDLISESKSILSDYGYKISVGHLHELYSKLLGHKSWNVASAKNEDLSKVIKEKDPFDVALSYFESNPSEESVNVLKNTVIQNKIKGDHPSVGRFIETLKKTPDLFIFSVTLFHEIPGWAKMFFNDASFKSKLDSENEKINASHIKNLKLALKNHLETYGPFYIKLVNDPEILVSEESAIDNIDKSNSQSDFDDLFYSGQIKIFKKWTNFCGFILKLESGPLSASTGFTEEECLELDATGFRVFHNSAQLDIMNVCFYEISLVKKGKYLAYKIDLDGVGTELVFTTLSEALSQIEKWKAQPK